MQTTEIAGKTYEIRECWCKDGIAHDATNADKIATGGKTESRCSNCRGTGTTLHLVTAQDIAPRPVYGEPIGEMPDWML